MEHEYSKEQEEPKVSFRQMNEFLAWLSDWFITIDDDIYESIKSENGATLNRREVIELYFHQYNL